MASRTEPTLVPHPVMEGVERPRRLQIRLRHVLFPRPTRPAYLLGMTGVRCRLSTPWPHKTSSMPSGWPNEPATMTEPTLVIGRPVDGRAASIFGRMVRMTKWLIVSPRALVDGALWPVGVMDTDRPWWGLREPRWVASYEDAESLARELACDGTKVDPAAATEMREAGVGP